MRILKINPVETIRDSEELSSRSDILLIVGTTAGEKVQREGK